MEVGAAPRRAHPPFRLPRGTGHGVIALGGAVVFALLAWGHLGLGARLFPPPATAARQVGMAGPYRVTLALGSGQFTPGADNSATVLIQDATGAPVSDAAVRVQPEMVTMSMHVPESAGVAQGGGRYIIHPDFAMAGEWRLDVTIDRPDAASQHVSFQANARWR